MLNYIFEFLKSGSNLLIYMVALPVLCGLFLWLFRKQHAIQLIIATASSVVNLIFALSLFNSGDFTTNIPYISYGFECSLRVYALSSQFILLTAVAFLLIALYSIVWLKNVSYRGIYLMLFYISVAMINGALLSDSLGLMLFFGEGLLFTVSGILVIQNGKNSKIAVKTLTMAGAANLILMLGIIVTEEVTKTGIISEISKASVSGAGLFGFLCIMLGAFGICGGMPFHSWIPDAADDAPSVFMAAFPAAIIKIFGGYVLLRTVLDIYELQSGSVMSHVFMIIGVITILFASAMSLAQKDMKRLISYISISQTGFIMLGIGSGLETGIAGAQSFIVSVVIIDAALFMISGIVEKQIGSTDFKKIGFSKNMPILTTCFVFCALICALLPGLCGFYSIKLISDISAVYLVLGLAGVFLIALSLIKLGKAMFSGAMPAQKLKKASGGKNIGLLIPVCILTLLGVFFSTFYAYPNLSSVNNMLITVGIFAVIMLLALFDSHYGIKKGGSALASTDHITKAPVLRSIYQGAQKGYLDPYNHLVIVTGGFSDVCTHIEHGVSWLYDKGIPGFVQKIALALHKFDTGRLSRYLYLAVGGLVFIAVIFFFVSF